MLQKVYTQHSTNVFILAFGINANVNDNAVQSILFLFLASFEEMEDPGSYVCNLILLVRDRNQKKDKLTMHAFVDENINSRLSPVTLNQL